jgi:hypothetical protein
MYANVNGKLVELREDSRIDELRRIGAVRQGDMLVKVTGQDAKVTSEADSVEAGARYRSIPKIVQG